MRVLLRRERRRRNVVELQGHSLPLPHNALVERGELHHHVARYTDPRILVTRDHYFASGIRHSPVPLCLCRIYEDFDAALEAVYQTQPLSLIVDVEDCPEPIISLLDRLRDLQRRHPALDIALLTPEMDPVTHDFIHAVCRCRTMSKRVALIKARDTLQTDNPPLALPIPHRLFKAREWSVLMLMARGHSLCHIARQQLRPYHRIIYRVGCILALLRLSHRQQLLRALQRVSALRDSHHSR